MSKVKIGVVGLHRGSLLAGYIAKYCQKSELTAVADLDKKLADDFAAEYNVKQVYYNLEDMLKSDVDAVVLATPIPDHAKHVVAALDAGKHVLSEVVAATTIDECNEIAAAIKRSGKKYMLEENYCYYRPLTIVKNMVDNDLLGDLYYAECDYLMDFNLRPEFPEGLQKWRKEVYFGTKGHPYITHSIGPLSFIMNDKIKSVSCIGAGDIEGLTADKTCVLLCKTEKGKLIKLRHSFVCARPDVYTYYSFQGTKGCYQGATNVDDMHKVHLRGVHQPNEWKNLFDFRGFLPKEWDIFPENHFEEMDKRDDCTSQYDTGAPLLLEEFANCILNDTEPPVSAELALNWTAAGIMSQLSCANGGEVLEVPTFDLLDN